MAKPRNQSDIVNINSEAYIEGGIARRYIKLPDDSGSLLAVSGVLQSEIDRNLTNTPTGLVVEDTEEPGMVTLKNYVRESSPPTPILGAGNIDLDCDLQSLYRKTGGTCTITFLNMKENQQINLSLESTGSSYTLTFAGETFKWADGSPPTPTATAGKTDIYSFIKIAGIVYGNAILNFS